jgi:hypothetical protein
MTTESTFDKLNKINVNDKIEVKNTGKIKLSYLSWSFAWAEVKKLYPNVQVNVRENECGLPFFSSDLGIVVKVGVTINELEHVVYLPVMDGANNAMKTEPYTYTTKYGEKQVKAATMMDINKAIQRATVKAIGLHGLGLYIYAGEDLPENEEKKSEPKKTSSRKSSKKDDSNVEELSKDDTMEKEVEEAPKRRGFRRR